MTEAAWVNLAWCEDSKRCLFEFLVAGCSDDFGSTIASSVGNRRLY